MEIFESVCACASAFLVCTHFIFKFNFRHLQYNEAKSSAQKAQPQNERTEEEHEIDREFGLFTLLLWWWWAHM